MDTQPKRKLGELLRKDRVLLLLFPVLPAILAFSGCSCCQQHRYFFWGEAMPQHAETIQDHWTDYGPFLPNDRSLKMRRGKAGVVRFYKKNEYEYSVCVDGELVVYVFEGADHGIELSEPKYKLVLTSEQLKKQRKYDKRNGFSYHIWLDLGEIDLPPEQISILTVFTENRTHEQVASGITYTQIGGEPTLAQKPETDIKKALDHASQDPARLPDSADPSDSNQILSVDLSNELVNRIASADPEPAAEEHTPLKTAYTPIQDYPDSDVEKIERKKLTFDDMRTLGSPNYGTSSYSNQGVIDPQGNPVQSELSDNAGEPNLLEASPKSTQSAGMAKVTYR